MRTALRQDGFALGPSASSPRAFDDLAAELGEVVGREAIRLRDGAHAYVARPGRVPLHTDHPEVDVVAWRCVRQDERHGTSRLLDVRPIFDALAPSVREKLWDVELHCPPLEGGPPTLHRPVLERRGSQVCFFVSPWLDAVDETDGRQAALNEFREALSAAARSLTVEVRLEPDQTLWVDNRRVMHGRGEIGEASARYLQRLWVRWPTLA